MKKIIALILVATMVLSLTGCDTIMDVVDDVVDFIGGGIDLEEGESYAIINGDGELIIHGVMDKKQLDDEFGIDIDDDEEDIQEDIQDYLDDSLEESGIDAEVTVTEVKVKDRLATITMEMDDFELWFPVFYESFSDYADIMGGFDNLATSSTFVTYEDGDDVKDKDLEDYKDGFVISTDGGDEGSYFEFESEIVIVSEDMDYEIIDEFTIFVEKDETGLVVLKDEVDCDPDYFTDMFDNANDGDTDSNTDNTNDGGTESNSTDGGTDDNNNTNNDTTDFSTDAYTFFYPDGSCQQSLFVNTGNVAYYYDISFDESETDIRNAITYYYESYFEGVTVNNVERLTDGVMILLTATDSTALYYEYGTTIQYYADLYGNYEDVVSYFYFADYQTGIEVDSATLPNYSNCNTVYINSGDNGTILEFPGDIVLVSNYVEWEVIDSHTIYISGYQSGSIAFYN
jgi:hypothetical protein